MNKSSYTLLEPDTRNPGAVAEAIVRIYKDMFPGEDVRFIRETIQKVEDAFAGHYRDFQVMDTAYHDIEHTLQATLCCMRILSGHQRSGSHIVLKSKDIRIAFCAMLLHDIGYLKKRGDNEGTGAKYTLTHEQRGCDIARDFLAAEHWEHEDIERVCSLILCTGPRSNLGGTRFGNPAHRLLGQSVCTADFLSQISDPGYVQKLPELYEEFAESDRVNHVPEDKRMFKSVDDLFRNTPSFWDHFVVPKLHNECGDVSKYLADPYPGGPNHYLLQVKENMAAITRIVALSGGHLADFAKHIG